MIRPCIEMALKSKVKQSAFIIEVPLITDRRCRKYFELLTLDLPLIVIQIIYYWIAEFEHFSFLLYYSRHSFVSELLNSLHIQSNCFNFSMNYTNFLESADFFEYIMFIDFTLKPAENLVIIEIKDNINSMFQTLQIDWKNVINGTSNYIKIVRRVGVLGLFSIIIENCHLHQWRNDVAFFSADYSNEDLEKKIITTENFTNFFPLFK